MPTEREIPIPVLMTERDDSPPNNLVVVTPAGEPNLIVKTMTMFAQVLVRGLRTYVQSFLGFLAFVTVGAPVAENLGGMIGPQDLWSKIVLAAGFALLPTLVAVGWNLVELLGKVDEMFPRFRA